MPVDLHYPEVSIQNFVSPWWEENATNELRRGSLIWALVPYVSQEIRVLVPEGRTDPRDHSRAHYRIESYRTGKADESASLPVAALPSFPNEGLVVSRAKVRPALVLSVGGEIVPKQLKIGAAKYQTSSTLLIAPFFGIDRSGNRGGWRPEFVARIRLCEYPQYVWDKLPVGALTEESVLRLDHLFPLGKVGGNYSTTPYALGEGALRCVDEWLSWLITGQLQPDGPLSDIRSCLPELEP